ncbi:hypothetical protein [Nocardia tengchongensis]|uniref:hypothetical protein n=1 Tax=Nocardia tengchongensis TaxID=2055889 RepID=UPI0036607CDC
MWIATGSPIPVADAGIDPAVRVAIGSAGDGVSGFGDSHQDAVVVYRLLASNPAGEVTGWGLFGSFACGLSCGDR